MKSIEFTWWKRKVVNGIILDEMISKNQLPELIQMKEMTECALNYRTGLFF